MAGDFKYFLPVGSAGQAAKLEPTTPAPQPAQAPMTDVQPMTPTATVQTVAVLPSAGLVRHVVQSGESAKGRDHGHRK